MTNKANLPAMAIIGASFSQLPNIFKGVFLYFWPFLLMFFLKDYYLISSIKNGLGQVGLIVTLLTNFMKKEWVIRKYQIISIPIKSKHLQKRITQNI